MAIGYDATLHANTKHKGIDGTYTLAAGGSMVAKLKLKGIDGTGR